MSKISKSFHALLFRQQTDPFAYDQFGEFREKLFIETLSWNLNTRNSREFDEFDLPTTEYLTLYVDNQIIGGFRAVRCDRNYLAENKFPQLAQFRTYPSNADAWEISRLGIDPYQSPRVAGPILYGLMFRFAELRKASSLVAFTTLAHEKHLQAIHINTKRFGIPQSIGTDANGNEMIVVAGEIPMTITHDFTNSRLFEIAMQIELEDNTNAIGRTQISA